MTLKFGTSGVRGLVTEMTDHECFLYTTAFVRYLKSRLPVESIVLAGDFRGSTPRIMKAITAAIRQEQVTIDFAGHVPTPAVVHYAMARTMASIMVTGSHIPDDRNGVKFNMPWGEVLKANEASITAEYDRLKESGYPCHREPEDPGPVNQAVAHGFLQRYLDFFPADALEGLKIVVYQHSAVIREMLPLLLERLGAEVVRVGWSDSFVPVDTEAVHNASELEGWVAEYGADALVSSDGDSDRPLVVDERGCVVRGDVLGVLTADYLEADAVAAPVSCNTVLERLGCFERIERTRIGSPYVIAAMQHAVDSNFTRVVGYEANGGFLTANDLRHLETGKVLESLPTRDCVLPILAILHTAMRAGVELSSLVASLPPRFTASGLLSPFPENTSRTLLERLQSDGDHLARLFWEPHFGAVRNFDFTDGVRMTMANENIVHLRPSGNAPEFRIYTESDSPERSEALNQLARDVVRDGLRPLIELSLAPAAAQQRANLVAMNTAPSGTAGMDVVIVSTTSREEEEYWQNRLTATQGQVIKAGSAVLAVHEDWPGGAGNGLGTLYALTRAREKGRRLFGIDIMERLDAGAAVAMYHTAGKGTRLAPLPASEGNNKPAVKLPGLLETADGPQPMTILEATVKQTAIYASSRGGRLSVFWGDQVFIPSCSPYAVPAHHAEIMVQLRSMPDAAAWEREGLNRYGLIAVGDGGDAAQVEKIDYATARALIDQGTICVSGGIGMSLGSFSISGAMLRALLDEFSSELAARQDKLDTDPHFWMPMTLDRTTYLQIMCGKGQSAAAAGKHFERMQRFKERLLNEWPQFGLFGAVDVGASSYWWDYGTVESYMRNLLKITTDDDEADAMRLFFGISSRRAGSHAGEGVAADQASCLLGSRIAGGRVQRSVLVGVTAEYIDVADAVLINVAGNRFQGQEILLYGVSDSEPVCLTPGSVRVDVTLKDGRTLVMQTDLNRDGKSDWSVVLPQNPLSYAELHAAVSKEIGARRSVMPD